MTRFVYLVPALACGCILIGEVGSGVRATETRVLDAAFDEVANNTFLDVILIEGPTAEAEARVSCDDNLLDAIELNVTDNELTVTIDPLRTLTPRVNCGVELVLPTLTRVVSRGSGNMTSQDPWPDLGAIIMSGSGDLTLAAAGAADTSVQSSSSGNVTVDEVLATASVTVTTRGSGNVDLFDIIVDTVDLNMSSSGDVMLVGQTVDLEISSSGSGSADARDLTSAVTDVTLSGSGDATIFATDSVTGRLSGSGDLVVFGGAAVDVSTQGSGRVERR